MSGRKMSSAKAKCQIHQAKELRAQAIGVSPGKKTELLRQAEALEREARDALSESR